MNDKALLLVLLSLLFNTCLPAQTADSLSGFAINTLPYFADSLNLSSPNQRKAINAFLQLKKPQLPEGQNLNDNWAFANGSPGVRQIVPLYEKYGVDIVLFGHLHTYQRTLPILGNIVDKRNG
ncbi:MAG: hypothetical protein KDC66_12245, partial [Phaeodactylibacter sp.]|nr:hypothetical protein [Phaeodactylibacter sp.]